MDLNSSGKPRAVGARTSSPWGNGAKLAQYVVQDWNQDPSMKPESRTMLSPCKQWLKNLCLPTGIGPGSPACLRWRLRQRILTNMRLTPGLVPCGYGH